MVTRPASAPSFSDLLFLFNYPIKPSFSPISTRFLGDFRRAAEIFLKLAQDSLGSKLGAFSAKGYFLQAVLSHLAAGDSVAAGNVVNTAKNTDHSYPSSRECTFSEQLIEVWLGR